MQASPPIGRCVHAVIEELEVDMTSCCEACCGHKQAFNGVSVRYSARSSCRLRQVDR